MDQRIRIRCKHQMDATVHDLIWRREEAFGQIVQRKAKLRPSMLMPDDGDEAYIDALAIGDQVDSLTGYFNDDKTDAARHENLLYVARQERISVRRALRCWRLWVAYRLGKLDAITQLGPAEMVAGIRDCEGAVYQEWAEGDVYATSDTGPAGQTASIIALALGEIRPVAA